MNRITRLALQSLAAATLAASAASACAQSAMIQQQIDALNYSIQQRMSAMNQNIQQGNQMINQMVQQKMQDPQVQAAYQQYLYQMQSSGQQAMDFPTYTYNWIYTRGFSREGAAAARANEAGIANRERATVQGLREAEVRRGEAMRVQQETYSRNLQEAGRGLMGQSTFYGPNGYNTQLPHTWQINTVHDYQGNTYRVDQSGQYFILGTNGWWYPINR